MPATSYAARIAIALGKLGTGNGTTPPADDTSNSAKLLAELFLWREVRKFAETKYEQTLKSIDVETPTGAGDHELLTSKHFSLTASVTEPVRRFSPEVLASNLAKGKYKVPQSYMVEQIDKAKVGDKPRTTIRITEV